MIKLILLLILSSAFNKSIISQINEIKRNSKAKNLIRETVERYGYLFEEYQLTTKDGYINTIYRIPGKKGATPFLKKPVMMVHGILDTPHIFLHLNESSLPFLLVNEGRDVWLPNTRGNYISHGHVEYDYKETKGKYWDYTMDDLLDYDIPETIEFIKEKTGYSKIDYIGHSQGATLMLLSFVRDPSYIRSSIDKFVGLATVSSLNKTKNPLFKILAKFQEFLRDVIPLKRVLFLNDWIHERMVDFARNHPETMNAIMEFGAGLQRSYLSNHGDFPEWFYVYPGGGSKNNLLQWLQSYNQKQWKKFDYGKEINLMKYGSEVPPEYNENNFKNWDIPSLLTVSKNDAFISYDDLMDFYNRVDNKDYITLVDAEMYNHIDICSSPSLLKGIIPKIVNFIENKK